MKYAVILPDGAADEPVESLGGRTPLEAATKPNMDWIAANGQIGTVVTVPDGFSPGSDVATLSLFGYDPHADYTGRAPLEAAAQGLVVGTDKVVFRCNFVTIEEGRMRDFTAGHVSTAEAAQLVQALNAYLGRPSFRFHAGVSYRNLLVVTTRDETEVKCTPPHDIPDQLVADHWPGGPGSEWVRNLMSHAHTVLAEHEVNEQRRRRGERVANDIWLWGQGRARPLQPFSQKYNVDGAVIAAVDLIRGIARSASMTLLDVPGATGYLDTDYAAKGRAAAAALNDHDLIVVHVEAPDEAGHQGDARAKTTAIERIDECIVGPLLSELRRRGEWRILVAPDHPTPVCTRIHSRTPPPYGLAGTGIAGRSAPRFTEALARGGGVCIDPGFMLMQRLLAR